MSLLYSLTGHRELFAPPMETGGGWPLPPLPCPSRAGSVRPGAPPSLSDALARAKVAPCGSLATPPAPTLASVTFARMPWHPGKAKGRIPCGMRPLRLRARTRAHSPPRGARTRDDWPRLPRAQ